VPFSAFVSDTIRAPSLLKAQEAKGGSGIRKNPREGSFFSYWIPA
jgi:hypothetical protein